MMRKTKLLLAATAAMTIGAGAASAQTWLPIIERQAIMNDRIDSAIAAGDMTTAEGRALRADLAGLVALEGRYRYGGLTSREKLDLDRRYAEIYDQVRITRTAGPAPDSWTSIEDKKLALDARIERGLASGQLTAAEAARLRDDFDAIASVEANYRVDGLSPAERADLNRRFDDLAMQIRVERRDGDRVYGWNRY